MGLKTPLRTSLLVSQHPWYTVRWSWKQHPTEEVRKDFKGLLRNDEWLLRCGECEE